MQGGLRNPIQKGRGFGPFGPFSDALGPTSPQVRAGQPSGVAKPLNGLHQENRHPLFLAGGSDDGSEGNSDGAGSQ
jgi:hypothetical protein